MCISFQTLRPGKYISLLNQMFKYYFGLENIKIAKH